ncbi:hypothetical protein [Sulfurimonas sp. HSL-1716]|uniref:hypothetical protein n=1 Tax=Hydrocurvibacter sulfurireducens TaxID=3131937 RepID=UPI0031F98740
MTNSIQIETYEPYLEVDENRIMNDIIQSSFFAIRKQKIPKEKSNISIYDLVANTNSMQGLSETEKKDIVGMGSSSLSLKYLHLIDYPHIVHLIHKSDIKSIKEFKPSYSELHTILLKKEFTKYETVLREIKIEESTGLILVGLLRLAYPWKKYITNWEDFLDRTKVQLQSMGENIEEELIGLV